VKSNPYIPGMKQTPSAKRWKIRERLNNRIQFVLVAQYTLNLRQMNPLTPNDHYSGRTAPLTSKRYSTNIDAEYFKHGIYSPFFFLFKMQFVS